MINLISVCKCHTVIFSLKYSFIMNQSSIRYITRTQLHWTYIYFTTLSFKQPTYELVYNKFDQNFTKPLPEKEVKNEKEYMDQTADCPVQCRSVDILHKGRASHCCFWSLIIVRSNYEDTIPRTNCMQKNRWEVLHLVSMFRLQTKVQTLWY